MHHVDTRSEVKQGTFSAPVKADSSDDENEVEEAACRHHPEPGVGRRAFPIQTDSHGSDDQR